MGLKAGRTNNRATKKQQWTSSIFTHSSGSPNSLSGERDRADRRGYVPSSFLQPMEDYRHYGGMPLCFEAELVCGGFEGRPIARGGTSDVYQVALDGGTVAAKLLHDRESKAKPESKQILGNSHQQKVFSESRMSEKGSEQLRICDDRFQCRSFKELTAFCFFNVSKSWT